MPSARIAIGRTTPLGSRIAVIMDMGANFRQKLVELNLIVQKYAGDASLQTDAGLSAADQTAFTNLLTQATNELNAVASTAVPLNAATATRQLLDALSLGG